MQLLNFNHLFTLNPGLDAGFEDQVLEDGGKGCDADSSADQNRNFIVGPLLMTFAKRAVQVELSDGGRRTQ